MPLSRSRYCVFFHSSREAQLFAKVTPSGTPVAVVRLRFGRFSRTGTVFVDYNVNGTSRTLTLANINNIRGNSFTHFLFSTIGRQVNIFADGVMVAAGLLEAPIRDESGNFFIGFSGSGEC